MAFSIYDGLDVLSGPPSFWTADCKRVHPNVALDVGTLVICISSDIWLGHMVMFVFFFGRNMVLFVGFSVMVGGWLTINAILDPTRWKSLL